MMVEMILSVRTFLYRYPTMKWLTRGAALLAMMVLTVRSAQAQFVMTFDGNSCSGTASTDGTSAYTESGFELLFGGSSGYAYWCSGSAGYAGSNSIFNNTPGGLTTLSRVGGGTFALSSIDLATILAGEGGGSVLFTGDLLGGGTITATEGWSGSTGSPALQTDLFGSGWTNLVDVTFSQADNEPFYQFDNVVLNNVALSVTPEPATVTLLAIGLVGVAGVRKRRSS
jgi:hypothetical protein